MKKVLVGIIALISAFVMIQTTEAIEKPKVTDHEKVTIYIFRGDGCPHCSDAVNYFYSLGDEYADYFEVVTYETWYNDNNDKLSEEVAEYLEHDLTGVPFIVVGEKYVGGFGDSTGETLIEYALEYYQDDDYEDIVAKTLKNLDLEVDDTTLEEAYAEENEDINTETSASDDSEGGKYDTLIIVGIFVVLIGGCVGLVVLGKK